MYQVAFLLLLQNSLSLPFVSLIIICFCVDLFGFFLFGILWASWIQISLFFPSLEKFSAMSFSLSLSPPSTPVMYKLFYLMVSNKSFKLSLLFILFHFCFSDCIIVIDLFSSSLILSSWSSLLLNSIEFFSSVILQLCDFCLIILNISYLCWNFQFKNYSFNLGECLFHMPYQVNHISLFH